MKPEAVAALFEATDAMRGGMPKMLETREGFRRFRDLAPNISRAHSGFAMATLIAAETQPSAVSAQWRYEARAEAQRAVSLDPKNPEGYLALGLLTPHSDLMQRQGWFAKGLAVDPENSSLCNFNGELLLDPGLTGEALPWLNRSLTLDPLSPPKTQSVIRALSIAGRFNQAAAMFPRAERLWPDDPATQRTIILTSLIYASPAQAVDNVDRLQASSYPMPAVHAAAWRRYEAARAGSANTIDAARRLAALLETSTGEEVDALIAGVASLGDADDAFRAIDLVRREQRGWSTSTLFEPATAALRKDPRFGSVAEQFGLTRYWTRTGARPDICAALGRIIKAGEASVDPAMVREARRAIVDAARLRLELEPVLACERRALDKEFKAFAEAQIRDTDPVEA